MGLSTIAGMMSSLKADFTPSASDCSRPNGPTRLGPTRICMRATTLRSTSTPISGMTIANTNRNTDLARTSQNGSLPNSDRSDMVVLPHGSRRAGGVDAAQPQHAARPDAEPVVELRAEIGRAHV